MTGLESDNGGGNGGEQVGRERREKDVGSFLSLGG